MRNTYYGDMVNEVKHVIVNGVIMTYEEWLERQCEEERS